MKIRDAYSTAFGRDLIEDLDSEVSGHLKQLIVGLWRSPVEYDCAEIYLAVKGAGTNEDTLNEIIGSRSNFRLIEIKKKYKEMYSEDLEDRIKGECSGHYEKLMISLLQCKRDETNNVNKAQIEKDVVDLYNAGEGKWGTDEDIFNRIFVLRSATHLYHVNNLYQSTYGKSLLQVIDSEFSGNLKVLLKTVLHSHVNPADYFSDRIYLACKGLGTNDSVLIRTLITIDEAFLADIKKIYVTKYKMTLEQQIKDETSGDYKNMLLELAKS
jgi:annexin A7/11